MKFHSNPILALTIASIIFPTVSVADGFESCNALLKVGVYNLSQNESSTNIDSLKKANFCAYDYSKVGSSSAEGLGVSAAYDELDFGASLGVNSSASSSQITEKQSSVCQGVFGKDKYVQNISSSSQNIYQGALDAWNQCQALAKKGIDFIYSPDPTMQGVTLTLSTSSSGSTMKFKGLSQTGSGRSTCKTTLPARGTSISGKVITVDETTSFDFNSASNVTITCDRQMLSNGQGDLSADAQTLVFNTSAGAYQIPLGKIGLLSRSTVDQVIVNAKAAANSAVASQIAKIKTDYQNADAALTNSTNSLTNSVNSLNSSVSSLRSDVDSHTRSIGYLKSGVSYVLGANNTCPAGYTDLGMIGFIMSSSNYGNNPFVTGGAYGGGDWTWAHPKLCSVSF
ncbi:MAG: hypothetical protein PHN45_08950 [Methylococcales bacterium]|nr:hypothetical protein [Methylococcales bacterium]MDD5754865.1 hypothetical protein [Methylococcales bacterium]